MPVVDRVLSSFLVLRRAASAISAVRVCLGRATFAARDSQVVPTVEFIVGIFSELRARDCLGFLGPGFLITIAYVDPGASEQNPSSLVALKIPILKQP